LWIGANCAGADPIGVEAFSGGSGCACAAREMCERELLYGGGACGGDESRGNKTVRECCRQ
jgi:hypothetical protein